MSGYRTRLKAPAARLCDNWLVTRPLYSWLSMIINYSRLSGKTPTPVRWWLDFKFDLFIPRSNAHVHWWFLSLMEIRLTKMKLNVSRMVPCKPTFTRIHHVSNCLLRGGKIGQSNSCYIKTCPRTNKINRKIIFWELLLSLFRIR